MKMNNSTNNNSNYKISSYCADATCVGVALDNAGNVVVVNTAQVNAAGGTAQVVFNKHEWSAFLEGAVGGEFSIDRLPQV